MSKLSNILDNLAEELGTVGLGWFTGVQRKLDLILSMKTFAINGMGEVCNDYSTSFDEWVENIHSIPACYKKVRGEMIKISDSVFKLSEEEYDAIHRLRDSMEEDIDSQGASGSEPSGGDDESDSSSFNGGYQGHLSLSSHSNDSAVWSDENMMSDD